MGEEKTFENKIKKLITYADGWFIKYWAGARYTKSGVPDIIACIGGKFYGIEVKASTGRPELLQLIHLSKIRSAGGYGILLYPNEFENFKKFISNPSINNEWYLKNIALQYSWIDKLQK